MKDRVVQYPHRYQLVPVPGESDTYDIIAKPGTVTEEGTPLNKATLLKDETAAFYGLTGDDATVDNALKKALSLSSYMAFCGNVNSDMLDAAFGKGNEDRVVGLGRQLAMYAWFKGDSEASNPFPNLLNCNTLMDIVQNESALEEVLNSFNLIDLIVGSPYAQSIVFNSSTALTVFNIIAGTSHPTLSSFFQDTTSMRALYDSYQVVELTGLVDKTRNPVVFNEAVSVSEEVYGVSAINATQTLYNKKCLALTYRVTEGGGANDIGYRPDNTSLLASSGWTTAAKPIGQFAAQIVKLAYGTNTTTRRYNIQIIRCE